MTMTDPGREFTSPSDADPSSPLGRLKTQQAKRQEKIVDDLEIPGYDNLVARVTIISDSHAAVGALQLCMGLVGGDLDTSDDMVQMAASVIEAAVVGLYEADENGDLTPVVESGIPVLFDGRYGQALGKTGIASGTDAVFDFFTKGDPPRVAATELLMFAAQIAGFQAGNRDMGSTVKGP